MVRYTAGVVSGCRPEYDYNKADRRDDDFIGAVRARLRQVLSR